MSLRSAALVILLPALVSAQAPAEKPDVTAQQVPPVQGVGAAGAPKPLDLGWLGKKPRRAAGGPGDGREVRSIPLFSLSFEEGPRLETLLWGGQGAVIGSFAGPAGAAIGGAVGAVTGFVIGMVYAPKHGARAARPQRAEVR